MREIDVKIIEDAVRDLCINANLYIPKDIETRINEFAKLEVSPTGLEVFDDIIKNIDIAREEKIPICQDTGMAVIFAEIGQEVHFVGGLFEDAINNGVERGYVDGFLRLSVVGDPLNRVNTNTNTPAIIHTKLVSGDKVKITVAPKGFGSENMSQIKMMTPSATREDIIDFVVNVVSTAGSNPCPPIVVGVGIGGDFELCALLAKKALCKDVDNDNELEFYSEMEKEILEKINMLGIGPQGFGGRITALSVKILQYPTHIAGLPVAVNIGCHVTRHKEILI